MAMTKEQALANARARLAAKAPAKRTGLDEAGRVGLRTARAVASGIGQIGDLPKTLITDPLAAGAAYLTEQMGAPETAASIRRYTTENPNPSDVIERGFDAATGYKPENKWERMGDTAAEFVTQAATLGLAAPFVRGAGVAPKAIQAFLSEGGIPGLMGAGGAGIGLEYGKEEFPDSPLAQTGLSLLGAVGGGAIGSAGQAGIRSALDSGFAKDQSGAMKMPGGKPLKGFNKDDFITRVRNQQDAYEKSPDFVAKRWAEQRTKLVNTKIPKLIEEAENLGINVTGWNKEVSTNAAKVKDRAIKLIMAKLKEINDIDSLPMPLLKENKAYSVVQEAVKELGLDYDGASGSSVYYRTPQGKRLRISDHGAVWKRSEADYNILAQDSPEEMARVLEEAINTAEMPQLTTRERFLTGESGMLGKNPRELSRAKTLVYRALVEEQGYTPQEAADLVRKAGKGELPLTLPELADNITLMRAEKRLRQNAGAAGKVEFDFLSERAKGLPKAIQADLTPVGKITSPDVAGRQASAAAGQIIKRAEQIRADKAEPFYRAAYNQRMDAVTEKMALRNPVVQKAFSSVQNDPIWQAKLSEYPENSLGRFDIVKRYIGDQEEVFLNSGEKTKAGILKDARKELTATLDEISPMYKEARRVFAKNSPKVERLQKSIVGALADMEQGEYAKAGKKLFEGTPTDIRYARRVFANHPEEWNQLVATHIADVGNSVNNSPMKLLNALSSKTAAGSVTKDMRLNAALTPKQIKAKDALFDNLERMTRIRGGSDTAENLMTDAQLASALESKGEKIARGVTTLRNYKNAPENIVGAVTDWFNLGVRNKNYEELARIFTGEGSEQFADEILRTKPGSPTAYKLIAKRISETSKASAKGGLVGERTALPHIGQDESGSISPKAAVGLGAAGLTIEQQRQNALEKARERMKQQSAPQSMIQQNEGFRSGVYMDTEGNPTVGYGLNLKSGIAGKVWKAAGLSPQMMREVKAGRAQIDQTQAVRLYQKSLEVAQADATAYYGDGFDKLTREQQLALMDMSYQMGSVRLGKFRDLKRHIKNKNKMGIVKSIQNSKYYAQTPERARRAAQLLLKFNS